TAILSEPGAIATEFRADEAQTKPHIIETDQTAILRTGAEAEPQRVLGEPSERQRFWHKKRASVAGTPQPSALQAAKPYGKFGGWQRQLAVGAIAVMLLVGGFYGYRYFKPTVSEQINSIAVLPFENHSSSGETDYLSDGLTDSLIFRFSQLPNLKVSPTSSVMRYRGTGKDVSDIARELDVDGVLSGRLTQIGDNLSISVQLIDARTKKLVWAEQYDRKMADLLATQRDIATTLTQKMQLRLAGDEKGITKKYTSSNEAYQLYLKGRYHWSKRTKDDLNKSVESFKQAINLDSNFALAYVGMAETYNSMAKDPDVAPKDAVPFAKSAATRALELDNTIAEGHSALADSLAIYDWNWTESEREFKKAIELDPNIGYIHIAYSGSFLSAANRPDEAIREAERGVELEPLSMINNSVLASAYILGRQYDQGLGQARKAVDLDPNFYLGKFWLGLAYVANGMYDDALAVSREVPESAMSGNILFVTALAYARSGRRAEAEQTIAKIRELGKTQYVRTYCIGWAYAALGDKDKAFAEIEKSFEDKDAYLGRARIDPFMDPLRNDPRFSALMTRMGLTQ
ncbi:MAG: hypothetical protein ABIV48_01590, partial [Pyrinomonadaceae bacterium]